MKMTTITLTLLLSISGCAAITNLDKFHETDNSMSDSGDANTDTTPDVSTDSSLSDSSITCASGYHSCGIPETGTELCCDDTYRYCETTSYGVMCALCTMTDANGVVCTPQEAGIEAYTDSGITCIPGTQPCGTPEAGVELCCDETSFVCELTDANIYGVVCANKDASVEDSQSDDAPVEAAKLGTNWP
jgi:hypothetical protein